MVERKDLVSCDMKRSLWIAVLFLLAGILSAQLLGSEFFSTYGYLGEYQLQCFVNVSFVWMDLFANVLWSRFRLFALFALICATPARGILPMAAKIITGFFAGFFSAVCVIQLGWRGVLFFAVCVFPHIPCYFLACRNLYGLKPVYIRDGKRKNLKLFLSICRICLIMMAGCVSETLVGTRALKALLTWIYGI